jgi:hypothetical protein
MRLNLLLCAVLVGAVIAACGGGGGSSSIPPGGHTITPVSTSAPGSNTQTIVLNGSNQNTNYPPISADGGTITGTIQVGPGSGSLAITESATVQGGITALSGSAIKPQSVPSPEPQFYETLAAAGGSVTTNDIPGLTLTLPFSGVSDLYEAVWSTSGDVWQTVAGPISESGSSVTFPEVTWNTVSLTAPSQSSSGTKLYLAIYTGSTIVLPTPERPIAAGDTFAFGGTLNQTTVFSYPTPSPAATTPIVSGTEPPNNGTANVTQTVTVTATACGAGITCGGGAVNFHTAETDAYTAYSYLWNINAWLAFGSPSGGVTPYYEYGSIVSDNAGNSYTYAYTTPYEIDAVPEELGTSWTNTAAETIAQTDADGNTYNRTVNANGTYSEAQLLYPDAFDCVANGVQCTMTLTENADGSGSYVGPAFTQMQDIAGKQGLQFYAAGVNPLPTGLPLVNKIAITLQGTPAPTPSAGHTASPTSTPRIVATPPEWYGSSAPVFYSESDQDVADVSFPGSCNVPSVYGSSGNEVEQSINQVDTVMGFTETTTTDTYVSPSYGPVCLVLNDTVNGYYNWASSQGEFYDQTSTTAAIWGEVFGTSAGGTKYVTTTTETLTLQTSTESDLTTSVAHGHAQSTGSRSTQSVSSGSGVLSPGEIAFARASFNARIQTQKRNRVASFVRTMTHLVTSGRIH